MIEIYTDGSCLTNPGNGGWAAIIIEDGKIKKISGNEKNTTNNRMELLAPINALREMNPNSQITIYTDSNFIHKDIVCSKIKVNYSRQFILIKKNIIYK